MTETAGVRRVALVTGAGRGIGAATAKRLAVDGYAVVAVDRCKDDPALDYALSTRADLDAVVAECGEHAIAVEADVRDDADLDAAVEAAVESFGGLDIAVAAAGVMRGGEVVWKMSPETWAANIDVNLSGVFRTARATVAAMMRQPKPRSGRFIAIASAAGMGGHPTIGAYCAAKHGVIGLVESLAVELGTTGITANCVCPGSTASGILEASRRVYSLESLDDFAVHHPIGRILQPEEIASAVSWLAAEAQSGVTGISLPVDGGMTI
jgi:SDR family mycofactocin-dependent oxidoreductase